MSAVVTEPDLLELTLVGGLAGFAQPRRGWERLYIDHVQQASTGADLDFLIGSSGSHVGRESH